MNTPPDPARHPLARTAARKHAARLTGLAAAIAAAVAVGGLAVMLLDYGLLLPAAARAAAGCALLVGLIAGILRWRRRRLEETPLKEAALDIESTRPDLGREVSTAAEYLAGTRTPSDALESELASALGRRAAAVDSGDGIPYLRQLGLPGLLFGGGVLAALVGFLVLAPQSGTALRRTLAPWSSARFTGLSVEPPGGEFPMGHRLTITNRLSGRIPRTVEFEWRPEGEPSWQALTLPVPSNAVAFHTVSVATSGVFRVRAGDSTSPEYALVAYIPPEVTRLSWHLIPPAYSGLPELRQSSAPITALRGTRARVEVTGNVPLGLAEVRLTNGTTVTLKATGSNVWQGELTVSADSEYSIVIADTRGRPSAANGVRHPIRALPDLPPKVDITEPGEDIRADPDEIVPLKVAASDDFGIDSITVVYHVLGGPEQRMEVRDRHSKDGQTLGAAVLKLAGLGLKPYDVVSYYAEARDNNTLDGPGIGRSPTYFIELTDRSGPPPSKRKGQPAQRLNLIALQKGILADTTGTQSNAPVKALEDLARRQREAREFTARYQERLESMNAPKAAQFALDEALEGMDDAARSLDRREPRTALPPEEKALAALYRAIRAMPQLKNLPTDPDLALKPPEDAPPEPQAPQIVLEAIEKKPQKPANAAELEEALAEALALAKAQSALADQMEGAESPDGEKTPPGQDSGKDESQKDGQKPGQTPGEKPGKKPGEKGSGAPGDAPAPPGPDGKPGKPGKPGPPSPSPGQGSQPGNAPGRPGDRALADRQRTLQERARRLAEKIARMKSPEAREAEAAGKRLETAARQMSQAAEALGDGRTEAAGTSGSLAAAGTQSAADLLERALKPGTERTDVSAEEAPAQFETLIGEYFRRLTRAQ